VKANLNAMRTEIQAYLESRGLAVFHGFPRTFDDVAAVYWNTADHADYREFLAAAEAAGVRLVTLYANEFNEALIDDALDRLDDPGMPREDRRGLEKRLRELRAYAGFTCQIELSFDLAPRVYVFDLRTEWFEELSDLLDSIDDVFEEKHSGEEPPSGYFSQN
jgi:hypothetical protein